MKGTIDITIKRKDGTIEKRQEHNVAFDLPAFIIKEWLKYPALSMYDMPTDKTNLQNIYTAISLSEEERDLTKPEWRPSAIKTVTSGSSSVWHTATASPTNDGKKRIVTAAWTMPSDEGFSLTLKSIAFDNANLFVNRGANNSSYAFTKGIAQSYSQTVSSYSTSNTYYYYYSKKIKATDFAFSNTYMHGLSSESIVGNGAYMPYSLGLIKTVDGVQTRTNDGRFVFVKSDGTREETPCPYSNTTTDKLEIIDDTTDQTALSFTMSQFTNWKTNYYDYTYIINTGTKNWLFQYDSSISASRIWQIPDTQTSDAIAPTSETFLQGVALLRITSNDTRIGIIGNYIISNGIVYKIADDLTVATFKGVASGNEPTNGFYHGICYLDKDYVSFGLPSGSQHIQPYFANLTASNFSTPITLAAGDVLSVSYSISVGE